MSHGNPSPMVFIGKFNFDRRFHIQNYNHCNIFVSHLENLDFRSYVRSGRWVGEASQTMYVRTGKDGNRKTGAANQYH